MPNDTPNLQSVGAFLTEKSVHVGTGTAIACAMSAIPVAAPVTVPVCVFGSVATAGLALAGHNLSTSGK